MVDFGTYQEDQAGHIDPEHEDDEAGEGAVDSGISVEMLEVEIEALGGGDQGCYGEDRAGTKPAEAAFFGRQKVIQQANGGGHQNQRENPAAELEGDVGPVAGGSFKEQDALKGPVAERHEAETEEREAGGEDCPEQSYEMLVPVGARVFHAVHEAERFHEADETGGAAPECGDHTEGEKAERAIHDGQNDGEDEVLRLNWKVGDDPGCEGGPEVGGRQPVDEGENQTKREKREGEVEGDLRGEIEAIVGLNLVPGSQQEIAAD